MIICHYHADFKDAAGQFWHASIFTEKHEPEVLKATLADVRGGIVQYPLEHDEQLNTRGSEDRLRIKIHRWAIERHLTLYSQTLTEFSHCNQLLECTDPVTPTSAPAPRFVLAVGAIREEYPDIPEEVAGAPDVIIWDRKHKQPVLTLHNPYGQLLCLEHKEHGTPFTDLETWLNELSTDALASENLPT